MCVEWRTQCGSSKLSPHNSTHYYLSISLSLSISVFTYAHTFMCICDLRKRTRTYMHYTASRWCGMKYRCRLISNAGNSGTAFRKFPAEGETFTTVEVVSVTIRRIRVHVYDAGQNCVDRNEFIANVQEIVVIAFLGKIWDFNLCFANLFRLWSVIKESFNVECYRKCIQCIYKLRINLYHLANPHVESF